MAAVFPRNEAIDKLFDSTAAFLDPKEAFSEERKKEIFDAVEGIREKARIFNLAILD